MNDARLEAVTRAARVVNNLERLRALLDVPMSDLHRWLAGAGRPSINVFLRAVDIVDQSDPPPPQEVMAIKARIATAELACTTWRSAGFTEKYLESYSLVEALEAQLEALQHAPRPPARAAP